MSFFQYVTDYLYWTSLFFTLGLLFALFISRIIGWSLYRLAHKFRVVNWGTAASGGACVAIIILFVLKALMLSISVPDSDVYYIFKNLDGLMAIFLFGISGCIGGAIFYKLQINANKKTDLIISTEPSEANKNKNARLTRRDWFWILWVAFITNVVIFGHFIFVLIPYVLAILCGYIATRIFNVFFDRSRRNLFVLKVLAVTMPTFAILVWLEINFLLIP